MSEYSVNKISEEVLHIMKDGKHEYTINIVNGTPSCTCPGFQFRGICKHLELAKDIIPQSYRHPRSVVDSMMPKLHKLLDSQATKWEVVGSYRRMKPTVKDIDVIALVPSLDAWDKIIDELEDDPNYVRTVRGDLIARGTYKGISFDLNRVVLESDYVPQLLYRTGSKELNIKMRAIAKNKGLLLNEHGLWDLSTENLLSTEFTTENEYFNALGMDYIDPSKR